MIGILLTLLTAGFAIGVTALWRGWEESLDAARVRIRGERRGNGRSAN